MKNLKIVIIVFVFAFSTFGYRKSVPKSNDTTTKVSVMFYIGGNVPFAGGKIYLNGDKTGQAQCETPDNGYYCSHTADVPVATGDQSFYVQTIGCSQPGCISVSNGSCGCYLNDTKGNADLNQPCTSGSTGNWVNYDVTGGGWSCTFTWSKPSAPFTIYGGVSFNGRGVNKSKDNKHR